MGIAPEELRVAPSERSPAEAASEAPPSPRARRARSRSIRVSRSSLRDVREAAERAAEIERETVDERPQRRSECAAGPRPCPHVACRHHLYLDVNPTTGTIKLNFPDLEVWELAISCALDVADQGATEIETVSEMMNVTRERIRQIEAHALARLSIIADTHALRDYRSE